ncbi:MAG: segregation/condensation protein A [Defluviitaleaceae bacterium]|nr:segregation/condensation protein A [Defluviitaleaceae bacterium]
MLAHFQQLDVKLSAFEGPLDVLCHLIQKNEIDIHDIPIALLTDQYLEFIQNIEIDIMESMSSFIVMGATLLEIKSRMLLPRAAADEEDPEELKNALIAKLIEYKAFKEIAGKMMELKGHDDLMYFKASDKNALSKIRLIEKNNRSPGTDYLEGVEIGFLYNTYRDLLKRKRDSVNEAHINFNSVAKELFTVNDKINAIAAMLSGKKTVSFRQMFNGNATKEEKIVTFLAVLEMMKMKMVNIKQDVIFGDISIEAYAKLQSTKHKAQI